MQRLDVRGFTGTLMKAVAAAGTTTTYSTTGVTQYSIDGKAYSKAAVTNGATPTTDINTGAAFLPLAANKGCKFVFGYDSSNTVRVAQGPIVDLDGAADGANASFVTKAAFPQLPDDFAPFAYIETKVGASGSSWTFGASNLAGPPSNVLHTFVDVTTLPTRP